MPDSGGRSLSARPGLRSKILIRDIPGLAGIHPTFDLCSSIGMWAGNRRETGSLATAPTATQSRGCSHSGIAPGLTAVFSLYVGRFRRSWEKRRRNEGRPRRGGSRSAGDRLGSRVSWSGVGAPGTPARGRRMVNRTSARPNAVARVSQQGGWIPAISLECPGSNS